MATNNAWNSSVPVEISKGGTNATSMSTSSGIVKFDGTSLVTSTTAQIDSSNRFTNTSQPAFLAYLSSTQNNVSGDATTYTIICDTEVFDQGSNYNNATGTFTAPVTGKYMFCQACYVLGGTSLTAANFQLNTSNRNYRFDGQAALFSSVDMIFSALADMDASDTATITVTTSDTGGKVDDVFGAGSPFTWFSAYLVC